jgi:hypothetical protein
MGRRTQRTNSHLAPFRLPTDDDDALQSLRRCNMSENSAHVASTAERPHDHRTRAMVGVAPTIAIRTLHHHRPKHTNNNNNNIMRATRS